jgi:hypothetical protein
MKTASTCMKKTRHCRDVTVLISVLVATVTPAAVRELPLALRVVV